MALLILSPYDEVFFFQLYQVVLKVHLQKNPQQWMKTQKAHLNFCSCVTFLFTASYRKPPALQKRGYFVSVYHFSTASSHLGVTTIVSSENQCESPKEAERRH